MSNMTLHPASQNFLVEISEACDRPGTIWASVITPGSQGMSKLQVWVELIVLPLGSLILIGFVAILLFTTCAPSTRKWPVAPESENAHSMLLVTWTLSKMLAASGNSLKLLA